MNMKRFVLIASALLICGSVMAQEETPSKFKLYGFIRNYATLDTRAVNAGTESLYFYMPKDLSINAEGQDSNNGLNWAFVSLTTRLGLDVSGYKWGKMGISGKVEADFYNLKDNVAILRLRQAFIKLNWDDSPLALTLGQAWHPMAADLPHMTNLETGAPFNPFNRSPQVTLDVKAGDFIFTASMLYLNHYLPVGPNGKSKEYYRNGLPEFYAGVGYKHGGFLAKAGVDVVNMKPYKTYSGKEANGLLTAISPFVFAQYGKGSFQVKAKAILAQAGDHMNLLSGYGVSSYDAATNSFTYTPMRDLAAFVSFTYGKKVQFMCMFGYMKQLGTTADLINPDKFLWLNTAGSTMSQKTVSVKTVEEEVSIAGAVPVSITKEVSEESTFTQANVCQAFRATPTIAFNLGKFTLSLEYNYTIGEYGDAGIHRGVRGLYDGAPTHWVHNHRFICMTKFNF